MMGGVVFSSCLYVNCRYRDAMLFSLNHAERRAALEMAEQAFRDAQRRVEREVVQDNSPLVRDVRDAELRLADALADRRFASGE